MNPATAFLGVDQVESMITESLNQFFTTMLGTEVTSKESLLTTADADELTSKIGVVKEPMVVAAVGFCGEIDGVAYIYFSDDLAQRITERFLGMEREEVEGNPEVVNDALGELANMVVGGYKNQLCDIGYNCRLTVPSIVRGSAFSIETATEVCRYFLTYATLSGCFAIDMIVKQP